MAVVTDADKAVGAVAATRASEPEPSTTVGEGCLMYGLVVLTVLLVGAGLIMLGAFRHATEAVISVLLLIAALLCGVNIGLICVVGLLRRLVGQQAKDKG